MNAASVISEKAGFFTIHYSSFLLLVDLLNW